MCVTNTTYRRAQPISLADAQHQQQQHPSGLTQRLFAAAATQQQQNVGSFLAAMPQLSAEFSVAPPTEKPRPKRRRKPQKPGKTAKMNDRHFVVHNYHDHSNDAVVDSGAADDDQYHSSSSSQHAAQHEEDEPQQRRKGGVAIAFPLKLHAVLDQVEADGLSHVISWQPHGRCFVIHQPKEFVDHVMPKYFRQTKLTSFQRQLNLYGFCRLTRGADATGYYHELFLRNKTHLCKGMTRTKVKGTKFKAASSPEQEPDFYTMPPVTNNNTTVTPHNTSDESEEEESLSHDSSSAPSMSQTASFYQPQAQMQQQSLFEPLPIQYLQSPVQSLMPLLSSPSYASTTPVPTFSSSWPVFSMEETDQVLDEAVEELFMSADSLGTNGDLSDFVHDWDPSNIDFAQTLENDKQLGYMLEKLLED